MALTINTRTYNTDRVLPDAVTYVGPAHTLSANDKFELKRVLPKPTKDFAGVAKPSLKQTKAVVIDAVSGAKADVIFTLSASLPVGVAAADVDASFADFVSACGTTAVKDAFKKLAINV